jgi:peptide/nickel transport system permease protein
MMNAYVERNARKKVKKRGQWSEVWHQFKRSKAAVIGGIVLILMVLAAIFADKIAPFGFDDQDISKSFTLPGMEFILGTDNLGRCIFSRLLYGARVSLRIGLISVAISAVAGTILGAIAGYYGGVIDNVIMRVMDILLAIPGILLAIAISAALGPGVGNAMLAIGVAALPGFARIIRSSVLSIREMEYIEAARAINSTDLHIITKYILPNVLAPIIVQSTLGVASAILQATTLSFLGLGVQPPNPEWGAMISSGRSFLRDYSYLTTFPGIAIMLTVFSLNLLGDGLRDALDPRLKR